MRLIDADELRKRMYHNAFEVDSDMQKWDGGCWIRYKVFENAIEDTPVIEAEPVRYGRWSIKAINTFEMAYGTTAYEPVYECSVCGGVEESYLRLDEPIMPEDADFPRYCPNCGAKMEEWE